MARKRPQKESLSYLLPLTAEAREAISGSRISVEPFPFRVGRDLRDPDRSSFRFFRERRRKGTPGLNEVYLADRGPPYHLSRKHFLIGRDEHRFFLLDRDSACGTVVEGTMVGGKREGGQCWLRSGDTIRAGGSHSPFAFRFVCPDPTDADPTA